MHSKEKIQMAGLNETHIEEFYGSYSKNKRLRNLKEFNEIDLASFMENTRSVYSVIQLRDNWNKEIEIMHEESQIKVQSKRARLSRRLEV